MDINELESFNMSDAVYFHDKLNPALWTEKGKLDPEVKKQLLEIAKDFMSELGISSPKVEDITISGSNAAYTYTPHSDLDLHILVDMNRLPNDEVYKELFAAKKTLYNDSHDIKVHGVPVELYVQDSNEPVQSLGEYSLLKDTWLKYPKKRRANFDQNATRLKYEKLGELIELALRQKDPKKIDKVLKIIKRYRKAGLDKTGEFGPENLAFKALRKQGMIEKLWDLKQDLHSKQMSIEDYDPNGPPPGPEFPPTMPSGTIRVDVSDVYDWYKLGQHISNMKGLGKHDFGKGPPSTILSFGDEDLEHKYIDALKKTGLDTTDIDPKGHEPMKGQKVDPTYNVGVAEGGAETSWSDGNEKITLQDILELTKHIKPINLPINDNLKSKLLHWDGNPEEIERINQVTVSNQFPILVMLDGQGQIDWILDGNHRLHKAIKSQAKTIPAKLIKPSDLDDKARRVFHINESKQKVIEGTNCYNCKWWKKDSEKPVGKDELNTNGGLKPPNKEYIAMSKRVDLVTLPGKDTVKVKGFCYHKDINDWVTERMCCAKWDAKGVIRDYKGESPLMEEELEEASGYIPSEKEKNDPRFKTALTVDVKPDSIKKNAKAFGFNVSRAGIPPQAKTSGKIK
jgi:hypothetical protein